MAWHIAGRGAAGGGRRAALREGAARRVAPTERRFSSRRTAATPASRIAAILLRADRTLRDSVARIDGLARVWRAYVACVGA